MNKIAKALNDKFFKSVDQSIEDKLTKKYGRRIRMDELTFEITNINTERRINGKTSISAKCIQDNMSVNIEILNTQGNDKRLIKQKLIEQHYLLVKIEKEHKDDIDVGTIL